MLKYPILLPIGLMLFLALLTFWINQTVQEQAARVTGLSRHAPDYMLYNFVSTRTDATGKTKYVLAAAQMRHYPDSDHTELDRPRFTQFGQESPYTQIHGQRGKISGNGKLVEFDKQVKVIRQATAEKGEMQMLTEKLFVEPDTDIAYTDLPVTIHQKPATVITGTGMRFDKKSETMQLFNRVHVHYERAPDAAPTKAVVKPAKSGTSKNTSTKSR
ncbi:MULTISPECIES: LPS export ABC transporter periplasmic protein LptC [unclassified Methylophilus]|jgi:lipopolysaccharide export system protein LptC|uniref:LPS export ABC transporter periplasmic protein LptC n=1 Tax=unclassified Methylophilus TaxID=2630143 RepID=UPI0006F2F1B9|nr:MULTISPECIES: LPS export ABC transporter periplasmic protein LptC [unclassified Methylophilus]KQT33204.1 LPS export ABC transporter periplasmic protein LptC [Methylophilus sp. Leaf414]